MKREEVKHDHVCEGAVTGLGKSQEEADRW